MLLAIPQNYHMGKQVSLKGMRQTGGIRLYMRRWYLLAHHPYLSPPMTAAFPVLDF